MEPLREVISRVLGAEAGQDMVEYGLILGLVSVVAVLAVTATGVAVNDFWTAISTVIENAF